MPVYSIGISELATAPVGTLTKDATWTVLGQNVKGSFTVAEEDAEVTEQFVEESDLPIDTAKTAGVKSFTTSIPDMDSTLAVKLFNATVNTSVVDEDTETVTQVLLPDSAQDIKYMYRIKFKKGAKALYFTNGDTAAKFDGTISDEILPITLKVTALQSDVVGQNGVEYSIVE